ncbi:hypothetical protein ScalyP_jg2113, partial [Parmales sp. scaly parma]
MTTPNPLSLTWSTHIPVTFHLSLSSLSDFHLPPPIHLLIPFQSYLHSASQVAVESFRRSAIVSTGASGGSANSGDNAGGSVWFSAKESHGMPLKWQLPSGVLHDLHKMRTAASSSSNNNSNSNNSNSNNNNNGWEIVVNFTSPPSSLLPLGSSSPSNGSSSSSSSSWLTSLSSHLSHSTKQSLYLLHSTNLSLTKDRMQRLVRAVLGEENKAARRGDEESDCHAFGAWLEAVEGGGVSSDNFWGNEPSG